MIAAWASGCELNFTNAQPAKIGEEEKLMTNVQRQVERISGFDSRSEISLSWLHGMKIWKAPNALSLSTSYMQQCHSECCRAEYENFCVCEKYKIACQQQQWEWKEEIFHLNIFSTSCLNKWKMIPENSAIRFFLFAARILGSLALGEWKEEEEKSLD